MGRVASRERPTRLDRLRDDRSRPRGRRPDRGGGAGHRLRPQRARRRHRHRHQAPGRGPGADGPVRARRCTNAPACWRSWTTVSPSRTPRRRCWPTSSEHCPDGSRPPLAGNTVATDRSFLARDMPAPSRRSCTTGSSTSPRSRSCRGAGSPAPTSTRRPSGGNHRALADIQESIEELRYYREAVFVPPPGPDSDAAKELAAKHGGALTGLTGDRVGDATIPRTPQDPSRLLAGPGRQPGPHGGCSSAGRAPRCGRGCRGFKSRHSPQYATAPPG